MHNKSAFFVRTAPDMHKKPPLFKHNGHQFENNLEKAAVLFTFFTF